MAATWRRIWFKILRHAGQEKAPADRLILRRRATALTWLTLGAAGGTYGWHYCKKWRKLSFNLSTLVAPVVYAHSDHKEDKEYNKPQPLLNHRERRFLDFASIEYDGNVYMTPQDFLESVIREEPRTRVKRQRLHKVDIQEWLDNTPTRAKGTSHLFRDLHQSGIISYTEYLFLLCVLTKPKSGFRIAFNMFDTDGNQQVDKQEFLVLKKLFGELDMKKEPLLHTPDPDALNPDVLDVLEKEEIMKRQTLEILPKPRAINIWALVAELKEMMENVLMETRRAQVQASKDPDTRSFQKIVSLGTKDYLDHSDIEITSYNDNENREIEHKNTTVLIHLFGPKGNDQLNFRAFSDFMSNLQTEVLQLEFEEYAKGMPTISEQDFARILLHYTQLNEEQQDEYLERLAERIPEERGIAFKDFEKFFEFLNSIEDFTIAMRLYTFADQPVSQEEFKRAVYVCTDLHLDPHLVNTVFQLFDIDGDGSLSHEEFISIMKSRLHRGFRSHLIDTGWWESFKACLKNEMRTK